MTPSPLPRVVLARRVEFALIGVGGLFLILGWGIGHHEWARAAGWVFTGVGFAIEMVYGRVAKEAKAKDSGPDDSAAAPTAAGEQAADDPAAAARASDEPAP